MHGMAIMMQCNLAKLSGIGIPTHIYGSSYFTTHQIIYLLAWQTRYKVIYTKLNEVGKPYLAYPNILHMLLIM
jgi:uncharacterized membrane protein